MSNKRTAKPAATEFLGHAGQVAQADAQKYPPFWSHKLHGTVYGDHHRKTVPVVQKGCRVEVQPGVLLDVQQCVASKDASKLIPAGQLHTGPAASAACRGQPSSAADLSTEHQQQPLGKGESIKPYEQQTLQLNPELAALESDMRQQLRAKATVHRTEKTVLLGAFAQVLGKAGPSSISMTDKVDLQQFINAWRQLGLDICHSHAVGIFNKYGQDVRGRMPVTVFVESLVVGAPRQMMLMSSDVQKGPYKSGQPATHLGKIIYPQCKTGVWPPSDWDPALADRSSRLPEERLELEWVYGYDTHRSTSNNIWVNCQGHIVTFAAAVCIVYDATAHQQTYFRGHDDDICCLTLAADRRVAASGQLGKDPVVLVWDTVTKARLARLQHGYGYRGIQALCFSSSGSKLATIATDNSHSLIIWNWSKEQKLMERKTQPGAPPAVYGVVWSRFEPNRLVTYGQNHIKFWTLNRPAAGTAPGISSCKELTASVDSGVYGKGNTHSVLSAVFLPSGVVLTGNPDGAICSWRGFRCHAMQSAHGKGPLQHRPDGTQSHGGVTVLVLQDDSRTLLSGGADGYINKWDVSSGDLGQCLQRLPLLTHEQQQAQKQVQASPAVLTGSAACHRLPPAVKALDVMPDGNCFVAGTCAGDVWEVDKDPSILLYGQTGDLTGCATNPHYPHVFVSVANAGKVVIWNAATHKPIRIFPVGAGMSGVCGCFSLDGKTLALGLDNGGIKGFEFTPDTRQLLRPGTVMISDSVVQLSLRQVWWLKAFNTAVDVVRFSPDGRKLAAGGHDKVVDIFAVRSDGLQRLCRCVGHSSAVKHLDWSVDGSCIQSMDQAYELLYLDTVSGKQGKGSCRDTVWSSYSCCLGFPVMGIWPPDSDGTDVNSVDRSPAGNLLLTADDRGKVKLFNWPCVVKDAPGYSYGGHSSHVTAVRWSADQTYAVSTGGHDRAVFQWRLVLPPSAEEKRREHMKQQQKVLTAVDPAGVLYTNPRSR